MRECNTGDGEEETELGGASFHLITGYPGDIKFPGRCDRHLFQFSSNWQPRCGTWSGIWLTFLFVTRMEVPRLTVPSTRGAGEEVNSPAGGARGDGGDVEGGVSIFKRLFEEGNWSLFLGGDFVQCVNIPLMMAGGRIQARK